MKKSDQQRGVQALLMMLAVWGVIECDFISMFMPNQILAFGIAPVIWGIGAVCILIRMKKQNKEEMYYVNALFDGRDGCIFFFVITGSIAIAASSWFYAGLKPLFIREYFSAYPLYTIRNILYYPLEVLLMLELLIYAQRAGELLTKKTMIPWGAFALFLLWGTPHLMHGFADGIVSALGAFIYAIPFYASGKKIKTSYVSMLILWFLV